MCMYNLTLNDELVQRTRRSFANETDMTAWLQRQVEALLIEYNTAHQTVRRNARAALETTGVENVQDDVKNVKTMVNGQIFILRGDKTYTLQGQEVK